MSLKKVSAIISMVTMAVAMTMGSAASAQFIDDGPTPGDFTVDGAFDQESYTAALITFQSAPSLELGGTVSLAVSSCPSQSTVTAEYVGFPDSGVETVSTGGTTTLAIPAPAGADQGYNVIRITCGALVRDQIVNLQPAGSGALTNSLSVNLAAASGGGGGSAPGGGLPQTGSDARTVMGIAAALLLLGGAVTFGAQRRFSSAA